MVAFTYIENRITDNCPRPFHYAENYRVWELSQQFNPEYAARHLTADKVRALRNLKPLAHNDLIDGMLRELPAYLAACITGGGVVVDMSNAEAFTKAVLRFWRAHGGKFPTCSKAARIIFALTPSSAAAEHVFSQLKLLFGDNRCSSLSDMLEGSLMKNHNKAKRASERAAAGL